MPYVEDRDGLDFDGSDPWKGYPVAIVRRVLAIIREQTLLDVGALSPLSRMIDDVGLDSLDLEDFALVIEETFAIEIADDDEGEGLFGTIGKLVITLKDRTGSCRVASSSRAWAWSPAWATPSRHSGTA